MKVSIITPTYNQSKYLAETIESVLGQDYPNIEYMILDDGSTDGTGSVIHPYLRYLTYVQHENIGENKTVNKGYHLVGGEIVCVVNADDPLFDKSAVSIMVQSLIQQPSAIAAYPDWVLIDSNGKILHEFRQPDYTIDNMLLDFKASLGPGLFIRRSALHTVGTRNETLKYTGDLDLSFRLALAGYLLHVPPLAASTVEQGTSMADEVLHLATRTLDSSLLPKYLNEQKYIIRSNACIVASSYCGQSSGKRKLLILKAMVYRLVNCNLRDVHRLFGLTLRKVIPKSWMNVARGTVRRYFPMSVKKKIAVVLIWLGIVD